MTEKQYRLNKWATKLLKNDRPLFDWFNDSDEIVDLLNEQEETIQELEKENENLKQKIEEETDRVIKLEQYVYTKLCPKSEHYNEKVISAIINTILGDVEMTTKDCFHCAYAQSNEDGLHCYRETRTKVKGTDTCEHYKK